MITRVIYFEKDNILYQKVIDLEADINEIDKVSLSTIMLDNSVNIPQPCIDISSNARHMRELSPYNVKCVTGQNIKEMWDSLDKCRDKKDLPPGSHELLYIKSLSERQAYIILNTGSFYDVYYSPRGDKGSPAKACACFKLLAKQNKLDYILDMNKFLWWYYANCSHPIRWDN